MCGRIGGHITLVHDVDRPRSGSPTLVAAAAAHTAPFTVTLRRRRPLGHVGVGRLPARRRPERARSLRCTRTWPSSRSRAGRACSFRAHCTLVHSRTTPAGGRRRRVGRARRLRRRLGRRRRRDRRRRDGRGHRLAHRRAVRARAGARRRLRRLSVASERAADGDRSTGERGTIDDAPWTHHGSWRGNFGPVHEERTDARPRGHRRHPAGARRALPAQRVEPARRRGRPLVLR